MQTQTNKNLNVGRKSLMMRVEQEPRRTLRCPRVWGLRGGWRKATWVFAYLVQLWSGPGCRVHPPAGSPGHRWGLGAACRPSQGSVLQLPAWPPTASILAFVTHLTATSTGASSPGRQLSPTRPSLPGKMNRNYWTELLTSLRILSYSCRNVCASQFFIKLIFFSP